MNKKQFIAKWIWVDRFSITEIQRISEDIDSLILHHEQVATKRMEDYSARCLSARDNYERMWKEMQKKYYNLCRLVRLKAKNLDEATRS